MTLRRLVWITAAAGGCGILSPNDDILFEWSVQIASGPIEEEQIEAHRQDDALTIDGSMFLYLLCNELKLSVDHRNGEFALRVNQLRHTGEPVCPDVAGMAQYRITVTDLRDKDSSLVVIHDYPGQDQGRVALSEMLK